MTLLEARGVRKSFGDRVVLDDLDLTVDRGECVVLIGGSGSGKSTLLRCLNRLETVDDGQIMLDGQDITDPRVEARRQAREMLERVGLVDRAGMHPDRLSGGQQQRVAIARALVNSPVLMLLDEVTSALDPELVWEVLALLRELRTDGMTMVLATHEMAFAAQVADQVCFLGGGRILEQGPPEAIFGDPQQPATRDFLAKLHFEAD